MSDTASITRSEAAELARRFIAAMADDEYVIVGETIERAFGWVFRYTTRRHAETEDHRFAVPGCGPFVVRRVDGGIEQLGSSRPSDMLIDRYEQAWLAAQADPET